MDACTPPRPRRSSVRCCLRYRRPSGRIRDPSSRSLLKEPQLEYETLRWEQDGHAAYVTLDRPEKKNAMSWAMFREIKAVFDRAADDASVRCLVITGAGG